MSNPSEPQLSGARDTTTLNDDHVIRYSREFLLECAKSPLVERPAALPPTNVWFGEVTKDEVDPNNGRKVSG
ncbi:hypothetical protein B0O80DRAFT_152981 [Mortierella sp. GBAus27b]|nr:hypothetical protein B0O80DRAFT_152981 [Mortierella sp. GBAus27b]